MKNMKLGTREYSLTTNHTKIHENNNRNEARRKYKSADDRVKRKHPLSGFISVFSVNSVVRNGCSPYLCAGMGFVVAPSVPDGTGQIVQKVV